jgi:hypothetical protein
MAFKCRHLFIIILILAPVPLLLLCVAAHSLDERSVALNPIGNALIEASKYVFNTL